MKLDLLKLGVLFSGLMNTARGFSTPASTALNQMQNKRSFSLEAVNSARLRDESHKKDRAKDSKTHGKVDVIPEGSAK